MRSAVLTVFIATAISGLPIDAVAGKKSSNTGSTSSTTLLYNGTSYTRSDTSTCSDGSSALRMYRKWWCPVQPIAEVTPPTDSGTTTDTGTSTGSETTTTPTVPASYTATLSWTPPSTREDGSPIALSELTGYEIYYTTDDLTQATTVAVSGGSNTSYSLPSLAAGTYHFAIAAIDSNGLKSSLSGLVSTTLGQ